MTSAALTFELPYPPSANRLWRRAGARMICSAEYEAWRREAAWLVRIAVRGRGIAGPYALYVRAGRPDGRRRDLDNLLKPISDALVHGGAIADDCDCQSIEARWCQETTGIRVTIVPTTDSTTAAARSGCAGDGEGAPPSSPDPSMNSPRVPEVSA